MKQIIFSILILSIVACQKQEVDCDNMVSHCKYVKYQVGQCPTNVDESGNLIWETKYVIADTSIFNVRGCPEMIEEEFKNDQKRTLETVTDPVTKSFLTNFPSSCDCN